MSVLKPIERFWLLLRNDKKDITRVYAFAIFHGLVNLSIPLGIQAIVNLIQGGQVSSSWVMLVVIVVAGVVFAGILQLLQLRIIETLQQKLFVRAAFEFTFRIPGIKSEVLDRRDASELMNRFFDTLSVQKGLSKILIDFSTATLQIFFGLVLLSFYHPFFIVFSFALILMVWAIFKLTSKRGLETSLKESKFKYRVAYWLQNVARNKNTFKLAGATDLHLKRTDLHVQGYLGAREGHFAVLRQQYSLLIVFKTLVAAGLLVIGGMLVLNQQMNIGQFIAAEIIILLVINSVEKLILSVENIYDVLTALDKIGHVTDLETEQVTGSDFDQSKGHKAGIEVEVNNVTFAYPDAPRPVISRLSLVLKPGEKVCLSGQNGSGKSTLLHLIAGLYHAQEGTVCFNGLPLGNFNPDSLRAHMGVRLSGEQLFQGTVAENITLGRKGISFDDLKWAADAMQLSASLKELPQGFDTEVGAEGVKLPKSVEQKILLARSIVNRPGLLLLENSVVFIEQTEREKIIKFLTDPAQPWTLIASSMDEVMRQACNRTIIIEPTTI